MGSLGYRGRAGSVGIDGWATRAFMAVCGHNHSERASLMRKALEFLTLWAF